MSLWQLLFLLLSLPIYAQQSKSSLFYDRHGNYIESQATVSAAVFLREAISNDESGELDLRNTIITDQNTFDVFTAAVYAESGGLEKESAAIASVIMNRARKLKRDPIYVISKTGVYGYTAKARETTLRSTRKNENKKMRLARAAVIKAYTSTEDSSNGAYFWAGLVFVNPESKKYSRKNWFVVKGWGTTPGVDGKINYLEVARYGGTVFLKNNPALHGSKSYP